MWLRILLAIVVLTVPFSVNAEGHSTDHRYKFSQIIHNSASYTQGIIIDQNTGDIWEYIPQPQIGQTPSIDGVRYLGKLQTGRPGERIIGNFGIPQK